MLEGITWASVGSMLASVVSAVFTTIVSTLKTSYEASHRWFAVGCVIFALLVWFGYAHLPTFSSKDAELEKQVASLSEKIDRLSANIDALKMPAASPVSSFKKSKK